MFTEILSRFLILETFLMGALCIYTCPYEHPQKVFCTSEFVLLGKIDKEIKLPVGQGYRVKIKKVFKGNVTELNIKDSTYVHVEMPIPMFLAGEKYAIFGHNKNGNIYSDRCKENIPWKTTTAFYKHALARYFKKGCDCIDKIGKFTLDKICDWHFSFMKRRGKQCIWIRTTLMHSCEKNVP